MKDFAKLVYNLDQTTKTNKKIGLLVSFFKMLVIKISFGASLYFLAEDRRGLSVQAI